MKVTLLRYDDGSTAFQFGSAGDPRLFDSAYETSVAKAFALAVNDGLESGEEIEGEAAIKVAEVLKAAGDLAWPAGSGYEALKDAVQSQLPVVQQNGYESCPWYVKDVALDGSCALIEGWDASNGQEHYVVPLTVHGDGVEATVVLGDKSQWKEVAREFVQKAGRMFSGRNLNEIKAAHDALGKLIELGAPALAFADEEEETEKSKLPALSYAVEKSDSAMRYTLGPLYAPMREDAHGEWIKDEDLHKSVHEFVRDTADTGRRINLQHGDKGDIQCGEWVEVMRWPYDHVIKQVDAAGEEHEVEMPAGTIYLGVVWDEDYWDVEKSAPKGINGYSLGGRAVKVRGTSETLKDMGYKKVRKFSKHDYVGSASGDCKICDMSESEGNHTEATAKTRDLELAGAVGATAARATLATDINDRLLDILHSNAKTGVTINETVAGLEDLVE